MVNESLPPAENRGDQKRRFEDEPRAVTEPERNPSLPRPKEPETRSRPSNSSARTNSPSPRTRTSYGPPCRGHGFPRSHGPRERKVDGQWLMNRYRRPQTGRIGNGALRTNQGPAQNLNEPEPAATKATRDARQALNPCPRPNSPSERTRASPSPNGPDVPHQAS
jgi:hypothetical protein